MGIKRLDAGSCARSELACSIPEHVLPQPFSWEYNSYKAPKVGLLQGWQLSSLRIPLHLPGMRVDVSAGIEGLFG